MEEDRIGESYGWWRPETGSPEFLRGGEDEDGGGEGVGGVVGCGEEE